MSNTELAVTESFDITLTRDPTVVLEEAQRAAKALRDVISKKDNPVKFNGQQYLEFEDWMTVGRFYGITAKIVETHFVDYGGAKGFEARAVAINTATGMEVSAAEAMCLNDEENWGTRAIYDWREIDGKRERVEVGQRPVPFFQLKSMAQTRACAKVLRNVLAWVVVLAGYRPTPAEEMTGHEHGSNNTRATPTPVISDAQRKRLYAIWKSRFAAGWTEETVKIFLTDHGFEDSTKITKKYYENLCNILETKTYDEYCDLKSNPV